MTIREKLKKIRKSIDHYRNERKQATDNHEYKTWLDGLILGLQHAETILIELEEENARPNHGGKQKNPQTV